MVIEIDLDKISKQKQTTPPVENNSAVKVTIGEDQTLKVKPQDSLDQLYEQVKNRQLYFLKKKHPNEAK